MFTNTTIFCCGGSPIWFTLLIFSPWTRCSNPAFKGFSIRLHLISDFRIFQCSECANAFISFPKMLKLKDREYLTTLCISLSDYSLPTSFLRFFRFLSLSLKETQYQSHRVFVRGSRSSIFSRPVSQRSYRPKAENSTERMQLCSVVVKVVSVTSRPKCLLYPNPPHWDFNTFYWGLRPIIIFTIIHIKFLKVWSVKINARFAQVVDQEAGQYYKTFLDIL